MRCSLALAVLKQGHRANFARIYSTEAGAGSGGGGGRGGIGGAERGSTGPSSLVRLYDRWGLLCEALVYIQYCQELHRLRRHLVVICTSLLNKLQSVHRGTLKHSILARLPNVFEWTGPITAGS